MVERFWIEALKEPYIRKFEGGRLFNFVWVRNNFVLSIWIFLCCEFFLTIFIHIYETSRIVMEIFLTIFIHICMKPLMKFVEITLQFHKFRKFLMFLWWFFSNQYRYVWNLLYCCGHLFTIHINMFEISCVIVNFFLIIFKCIWNV
jgi:hypothetical protein